jgi:Raf kinase inhibitor-like YbhB/YbcL family protein
MPLAYHILKNAGIYMSKMKASAFILVIIIAAGALFCFIKSTAPKAENSVKIITNQAKNMKISSPAFENGASIPQKYACDGESASPPLEFSGVPEEAKSLALIMDDPDAPVSGGFVHWVVFDMDPAISGIAENAKPASGTEGTGSSGRPGYTSPCPPSGAHHYHFKLYALDINLGLDSSAAREDVEKAMEGHILDQAELIGLYQKQ